VTFVDAINVSSNVNNNKMVLFAYDRVLIKLLREKKEHGNKKGYHGISQQAVDTVRMKQMVD